MEMGTKKSFDWGSLLLGVLFVITAVMSFRRPLANLLTIVMVYAIFSFIKGIYEIFFRSRLEELTGYQGKLPIVLGVIDIIIGIFLLFNTGAGVIALPFIFAIWFIIDSVFNLFNLEAARKFKTWYFWFSLIINVLGVILGIYLFLNPLSSALTLSFLIGCYFMMFGIKHIIFAFSK
ncbi:HdeD family acid-resistance protein [Enterococcus asini]|uniref:HdeD family acid-resistance protein n=2 Tax=Enterococcus TaxID=1350 RepID=UPI0037BED177